MTFSLTFNPLYCIDHAKLLHYSEQFGSKPYIGGLNMADKTRLIDCQSLSFSPQLSKNRMGQAQDSFSPGVIQRILCFALYLLGLNRSAIGRALGIPPETAKSIIKALMRDGLKAFEDRRLRPFTLSPNKAPAEPPTVSLREDQDHVLIDFGFRDRVIKLCRQDPLQMKTVLLSILNSGLLSTRQVAEAIGLTPSHTATLARRLQSQGARSLMDHRQGQQEAFVVTPAVKAELIQQFAVDVITSGRTSSTAISQRLKERCDIVIPDRTIRHHLARLGLAGIKHSLPQLVAAVKKISNKCSGP
jgi:transposase